MKKITKTYATDELEVKWQPDKCIHSAICAHGLPSVFDPGKKPWVSIDGANKEEIIKQVKLCPSGALSIKMD